jgi:hypothetical protein
MKKLLTSTVLAAALAVASPIAALASETVHILEMKGNMKVSVFLGLDDPYPLMSVEDFCSLPVNAQNIENCSADAWIKDGKSFSFKT